MRRKNMKSLRLMLTIALMSFTTLAFAQHEAHMAADPVAPQPEAQKSFDEMKGLAGNWEGPVTVTPPQPGMTDGTPLHVSMRVTSRGNALVHEMQESGTPMDPAKYDHPLTMIYLDGSHLTLVHYCDAGNRPRMIARPSADGKSVEFDFSDISGGQEYGHMHHAVFTFIDANHHIEDWTYMMPGDKPAHAHFDLKRVQ
jgi:hypothetical protein